MSQRRTTPTISVCDRLAACADFEALTDRIDVAEIAFGKRFADHGPRGDVGAVAFVEQPPASAARPSP
jgi:hypothetical protein